MKKGSRKRKERVKKWTILVSSKASSRVIQLKIPKFISLLSIIIFSSLCIGFIISQFMVQQLKEENGSLNEQLFVMSENYKEAEEQITYYETETYTLKEKVRRLDELEQELKKMITSLNPEYIQESKGQGPTGGIEYSIQHTSLLKENNDLSVHATNKNEETIEETYDKLNESVPKLIKRYQSSINNFNVIRDELINTPTFWPTEADRITSTFGSRDDPFTAKKAIHTGIDIAGSYGTPVFATANGTISFAGYNGGYGRSVEVRHSAVLETRYAHLSKIIVSEGQQVEKGETIGYMGSTGRSTGVHLHYEILNAGDPIDPFPYMTFMKRVLK